MHRTVSLRPGLLTLAGLVLMLAYGSPAKAQYFVNAFAGSPLAYYLFGDTDMSTAAAAVSSTFYTDGVNIFSSEGSSSADLATGSLHSLASANFGYDPGALPNPNGFQFGNSSFGDSLTFLGDFSGQHATFHISVDGTWSGDTAFNGSDFQFMVLPAGTIDANAGNTLNIFNNPGNVALVNDLYPLTPTTANPLSFDADVTLNGHDPTLEFAANLDIVASVNLGQSFSANYSDTAAISLTAPGGVTVISGSGVFPGTVPEPSTLALLLGSSLIGSGLMLRRRRK